jgi:hypothetical protein
MKIRISNLFPRLLCRCFSISESYEYNCRPPKSQTWRFSGYEGESVNRSQMDVKRKTYDIWSWKKNLFLDISYTKLIHLSHCFTSASKPAAFWVLPQPLPHPRFNLVISETFAIKLWTALLDKHFQPYTGSISIWIFFALSPFAHKKRTRQLWSSVVYPSSTVAISTTKTSL